MGNSRGKMGRRAARASRGQRFRVEKLEPRHVLSAANLVISEFMASNGSTLADGDGEYSDWIEIHNQESFSVNLSDYFLTDDNDNLTRWAFPSTTLGAGGYLVVFASSPIDAQSNPLDDYVDGGGYLHANFGLGADGEYLALTYQDPASQNVSVVHEYAPEYPAQRADVSYGLSYYYDVPTPGAANGSGYSDFVADTTFSVDRGFFDASFQVEITSATPGAQIYYTTNGKAPTAATGTLYAGPLTIDHTTVLRAIAYHPSLLPTNVDTQTYLFLNDILQQDYQATLAAGLPSQWGPWSPDYGLDQDVVGVFDDAGNPIGGDDYGGQYAALLKDGLLSIPTISIVADANDLFGVTGIYTNPQQEGPDWERPASMEWITADGSHELQVDAGLQIQGGFFRSNSATRKHSFRLVFKSEYGPSELEYPLFEDATDVYNTIVLRAGANDGYSWNAARYTEQYIRDEFGRSLQNAAGRPSAHGNFAHLYINGVYWGLYNPVERPDAEFAATYFGGHPDNWDSIHVNDVSSGDSVAWNAMLSKAAQAGSSLAAYWELQGLNSNGTPSGVPPLLNVQSYIDYIAINVWGGNWDWPWKNWWAGRDRADATTTGFEFFNWDFENTMGNNRSRSPLNATTLDQDFTGTDNAGQAHTYLKSNAEYRLAFADHVHKLMFNGGVLTPESLIARYSELADAVELAMVGESARWGDQHWSTPLTQGDWLTERNWILNDYLPNRSNVVLQEFKNFGLYPNVVAPSFSQHGGPISPGFQLTVSAPSGTIWYTLDGSDPRQIGGAVSPNAVQYTGAPIAVSPGTTVRARVRSGSTWSALNEAEFVAVPSDVSTLRITELHYHPEQAEELEFIEIVNAGTSSVDLAGVKIASFASDPYVFDAGLTLAAGERIVVARNPTDFHAFYGTGINMAPTGYANANLSNGGETISLVGPGGEVLQHFTYEDSGAWPAGPDGNGPSLEYVGPLSGGEDPLAGAPDDPFDDPSNWRASLIDGGSPGTDGNIAEPSADFDGDGSVSGRDFLIWQRNFGGSGGSLAAGDADLDGNVDAGDLVIWQSQYGSAGVVATVGASALDPTEAGEPSAAVKSDDVTENLADYSNFWLPTPQGLERFDSDWIFGETEHPVRRQARFLHDYDEAFAKLASEPLNRPHYITTRIPVRRATHSGADDQETKQSDRRQDGMLIRTALIKSLAESV